MPAIIRPKSNIPDLTRTQKAAVMTLGRSVSVAAGAGSGKTEVLIRRFCHIIEKRLAPADGILAVTFTEKAAGEMQSRIRSRLEEIGRRDALAQMESAFIGTIHGFCRRILYDNPVEACLDPCFSVLSESDSALIAGRILDEILSDVPNIPGFTDRHAARRALLSIYGRLRGLRSPGSTSILRQPPDPTPYLNSLSRCLDALLRGFEKVPARVSRCASETLSVATRLAGDASAGRFDWEKIGLLSEACGLLTVATPSELVDRLDAVRSGTEELAAACLDLESARDSSRLLDLISELEERYSEEKQRSGVLDYDDLILRAGALLSGEDGGPTAVADWYREKLRFVILDEFQDTNRAQKRIIDAVSRSNNVFTVGDARQSIFSFAQADVEVFRDHQRMARRSGARFLTLRENFRSRPGILRFINELFGEVWREDPDCDYRPVSCPGLWGRKASSDVEIISAPLGQGGAETGRRNEAAGIAERILEMIGRTGQPPLMHSRKGREGSSIGLGDIVILLRSTANLGVYEAALRARGIEVRAVSGRGFYSAPEVQEVVSLLRVGCDPLEDEPLGNLLRSSFIGVSEPTIQSLAEGQASFEGRGRLWTGLQRLESLNLPDSEAGRLLLCRAMVSELRAGAAGEIADSLETVLQKYGFMDYLLNLPDGRRRYANVRKLQEMARDFMKKEIAGTRSFLRHTEKLRGSLEREAEIDSAVTDAVRIMTVHKSKGLQSPVVIIADMGRMMERPPGRTVFDPEFGISMEVRDPISGQTERSMGFTTIAERIAAREASEEKRLLYVAMTRAEEHLVLAGCSDLRGANYHADSESRSWAAWLEKILHIDSRQESGILRLGSAEVDFRRILPSPSTGPAIRRVVSDTNTVRRIGLREDERPQANPPELSVSGILDYLDCPAMFRFRHLLGMPGDVWRLREKESPAAALGTSVHAILEKADLSVGMPDIVESLPEEARTPIERFYGSRWFQELRTADNVLKEKFFRVNIGGTTVAGRMDVIYHGPCGWSILDYKTGRGEDRERYELQVGIYSMAAERLFGELPVRAVLLLLSMDEEWVVETSDGEIARRGAQALESVSASIALGHFSPAPGKSCRHCQYTAVCELSE